MVKVSYVKIANFQINHLLRDGGSISLTNVKKTSIQHRDPPRMWLAL